jgi:hypothetical protein
MVKAADTGPAVNERPATHSRFSPCGSLGPQRRDAAQDEDRI